MSYTNDRSVGSDEPPWVDTAIPEAPKPEQARAGTSLISASLLASINDLLKGGRIDRIDNNDQLQNALALKKQLKVHRLDLADEKEKVTGPLYAEYKTALAVFTEKIEALSSLEKNLDTETGRYGLEQKRIADDARRKAEEAAATERRRLAELESKRLEEEEALRRDAAAKVAAAEAEQDAEKRAALIEAANTANAVADIALKEAADAAIAVDAVVVHRVQAPAPIKGFKPEMAYSAEVTDYVAAAIALLTGDDKGYIMSEAFKKNVQSAANKKAKFMGDKFQLAGCSKIETPVG